MARPRDSLFFLTLLMTGGCGSGPFAPFAHCDSCSWPETNPPVGTFLFPRELEFVRATDFLHVAATDDIRVAHVEIFWIGLKVHTGVIAAPPYIAQFEGHPGINLGMVNDSAPLYFTALVTDVEGNVDTVEVIARFDRFPFEEGQKLPDLPTASPPPAGRTASLPPPAVVPGRSRRAP